MSVRIYFSHQTEVLAAALSDTLTAEAQAKDPFAACTVIVPNPNVKKWLQIEIAKRQGIAANIGFQYLQDGLWSALSNLSTDDLSTCRHLSPEPMQMLVLSFLSGHLQTSTPTGKALAPVAFMLQDQDGDPCRNYAQRLWQLAGQLGTYLQEYEFHRQEMVRAWLKDESGLKPGEADPDVIQMTQCQKTIYCGIFGKGGLRDQLAEQIGTTYCTLPQLAERVFGGPTRPPSDASLHVYGLSQMSNFRRDLLLNLGRFYELSLYQFNVCSEFWEDVSTPREDRWARMREIETETDAAGDEELAWDENENIILKWWGKPGRENVKLFSDLEDRAVGKVALDTYWLADQNEDPVTTVLETIQHQVLTRSQTDSDEPMAQDRSIQIAGCPGIFREVETVHNSIVNLLRDDPELSMSDIAILVPNVGRYKPVIRSVFEREPAPISYNLTDSNASQDSAYGKAVMSLLRLVGGDFTRREVFDLVLSPYFLAARRMQRDDALTWVQWADQLNIFHSFDQEHRESRGLAANKLYTWEQGLQRLRLGRIFEPPDDSEADAADWHFQGVVPYSDMASGNIESVGQFGLVIEILFRRLQQISGTTMTCAAWSETLRDLLDTFLAVPDDRPEEATVRRQIFEGLSSLGMADQMLGLVGKAEGLELGYVLQFIEGRLSGIPSRKGSFLSGGVTIAELRPNRAMPFQVVYIMGLGEGDFPGSVDYSSLDLRRSGRRLGDISRPEEDRYTFLETLMSTRDRLYLTYVSHNLQKDQVCHPGSLIVQLETYLERNVLHRPFQPVRVPLKGSSDVYLQKLPDWQDMLVNYSQSDRLLCLQKLEGDPESELTDDARQQIRAEVEQRLPEFPPGEDSDTQPDRVVVNLYDLQRFLMNPLEAALRWHLHLYERDEGDPSTAVDEPFFSESSIARNLLRDTLDYFVRTSDTPDGCEDYVSYFCRTYEDRQRRSEMPDGAFSDLDRARLLDSIRNRIHGGGSVSKGLVDIMQGWDEFTLHRDVTIGSLDRPGRPEQSFPALEIELGGGLPLVEIHGSCPYIWRHRDGGSVKTLVCTQGQAGKAKVPSRPVLMPFLFYVAAKADETSSEWIGGDPFAVEVAGMYGGRCYRYAMDQTTAREYLKQLLVSFLGGDVYDVIPFAVFDKIDSRIPQPYAPGSSATPREKGEYARRLQLAVEEAVDNPWSSWYPSPLVTLANGKVPNDVWDKIHARFQLFYDILK